MDSILSDRLPALVRPGNNLVLRRIRNLMLAIWLQVAFQASQPLQLKQQKNRTKGSQKKRSRKKKKGKGVSFGKA